MKLWIDTGRVAGACTLFGLPSVERIRRSAGRPIPVKGSGNPPIPVETTLSGPGAAATPWPGARVDASSLPLGARLRAALAAADAPLVAVDGADVVDPRLVTVLGRPGPSSVASRGDGAHRAVALRLDPSLAEAIPERASSLVDVADALLAAGCAVPFDESVFPAYVDKLRRSLPYWLYAIPDRATQARLEHRMFWDNYKGSTDFLTRWVYPPLVWPMVRLCTRLRIHPNAVTVLSIVLTFAAVPLFAAGEWVWGFAAAYGMSVLDSVDGKVARLTLTDSWIGNLLDHGLDLVHPPFWYFAWAWGLGARELDDPLLQAGIWLIVFYVADRLVLRVAKQRLRFALHAATPLDGRVRSFIARRNITMTIMAAALAIGAGPAGLWIVTAWQGLTFAWHGLRTLQLGYLATERPRPGGVMGTGTVTIVPVVAPAELDRFIRLPSVLYAADPSFVPQLVMERREALSPKKNPLFQHATAQFWLAVRDGRDVGRISAQDDTLVAGGIGQFGMIVAIDDAAVFAALFAAAEAWLRARGKTKVQGPFNLSINEETGLLIDGFDTPPMIFMAHDPAYAAARIEALGYAKAMDLTAFMYDIANEFPPAARRMLDRRRPEGLVVRSLDMTRYEAEMRTITSIFNDAWSGNWGFVPFTEAEVVHMAKSLKLLIDPQWCAIVEMRGEPVGFGITVPNLNEWIADLGGKLLPFNWARLLWRMKRGAKTARVPLMGIRRSFSGGLVGGLAPFLIVDRMRAGVRKDGVTHVELSWILESNKAMRAIIKAVGGVPYKTYRVFEKALPP